MPDLADRTLAQSLPQPRRPPAEGGDDPAAFQRDSAECEQQAASGKWKDCMNGKGWLYDTRI